jgi:hypothetical protein
MPLLPWILGVSLAIPAPAFAQGPAADISPAEDDPDRPTALVHIESDAPVLLELRDDHRWIAVCIAPCEGRVPLLGDYRITGDGVRTSDPFRLNRTADRHVSLNVKTASSAGHLGAILTTALGGATAFVGWIWVLATLGSVSNGSGPDSGRLASGIAVGSAGLAAVVVGVALLAGYPNTNVKQGGRGRRPSQDAWLRLPAWRESETRPTVSVVPFGLPLFEATF